MCTVLLRFTPGERWPLLVAAVRDEFTERAWDPPGAHWDNGLIGGRDRVAGGTWLAVDPRPERPAFAALLNGVRLPLPADGVRPSRGALPLLVLTGQPLPDPARYDGYHLLRGGPDALELWSWDGSVQSHVELAPGDHIVVNDGPDSTADPLVGYFAPLLAAAATPDPVPGRPTAQAWGDWLPLVGGAGLDPGDARALVIRREFGGHVYGSTSATLLALGPEALRYDFTANPGPAADWQEVTRGPAARG
jgi:hypothetical protein